MQTESSSMTRDLSPTRRPLQVVPPWKYSSSSGISTTSLLAPPSYIHQCSLKYSSMSAVLETMSAPGQVMMKVRTEPELPRPILCEGLSRGSHSPRTMMSQ